MFKANVIIVLSLAVSTRADINLHYEPTTLIAGAGEQEVALFLSSNPGTYWMIDALIFEFEENADYQALNPSWFRFDDAFRGSDWFCQDSAGTGGADDCQPGGLPDPQTVAFKISVPLNDGESLPIATMLFDPGPGAIPGAYDLTSNYFANTTYRFEEMKSGDPTTFLIVPEPATAVFLMGAACLVGRRSR